VAHITHLGPTRSTRSVGQDPRSLTRRFLQWGSRSAGPKARQITRWPDCIFECPYDARFQVSTAIPPELPASPGDPALARLMPQHLVLEQGLYRGGSVQSGGRLRGPATSSAAGAHTGADDRGHTQAQVRPRRLRYAWSTILRTSWYRQATAGLVPHVHPRRRKSESTLQKPCLMGPGAGQAAARGPHSPSDKDHQRLTRGARTAEAQTSLSRIMARTMSREKKKVSDLCVGVMTARYMAPGGAIAANRLRMPCVERTAGGTQLSWCSRAFRAHTYLRCSSKRPTASDPPDLSASKVPRRRRSGLRLAGFAARAARRPSLVDSLRAL